MISSFGSGLPQNNLAKDSKQMVVHYQKNNLIGKGTFGKVYTALDLRSGGLLAVKCIKLSSKTDR